jgi:hypothetical protein
MPAFISYAAACLPPPLAISPRRCHAGYTLIDAAAAICCRTRRAPRCHALLMYARAAVAARSLRARHDAAAPHRPRRAFDAARDAQNMRGAAASLMTNER